MYLILHINKLYLVDLLTYKYVYTKYLLYILQYVGTDCQFWMIIHTCALIVSVCWFADKLMVAKKYFCLALFGSSSMFLVWIVWLSTSIELMQQNSSTIISQYYASDQTVSFCFKKKKVVYRSLGWMAWFRIIVLRLNHCFQ